MTTSGAALRPLFIPAPRNSGRSDAGVAQTRRSLACLRRSGAQEAPTSRHKPSGRRGGSRTAPALPEASPPADESPGAGADTPSSVCDSGQDGEAEPSLRETQPRKTSCPTRVRIENKGDSAKRFQRVIMTIFHELSRAEGPWGQGRKTRMVHTCRSWASLRHPRFLLVGRRLAVPGRVARPTRVGQALPLHVFSPAGADFAFGSLRSRGARRLRGDGRHTTKVRCREPRRPPKTEVCASPRFCPVLVLS